MKRVATWLLMGAVGAVLMLGCGAQLEKENNDGSNFNPEDFETEEKQTVVVSKETVGMAGEEEGPRDPDGLLHRVRPEYHEYLKEIRIDADQTVLLVFRGNDAIKLDAADIDELVVEGVRDGKLVVKVRSQEFLLNPGDA